MQLDSSRDYQSNKYVINEPADKEYQSDEEGNMKYDSDDLMGNKSKKSMEFPKEDRDNEGSPRTMEDLQANLRQEIIMRKVKNEANQQLAKFKKCLSKQDHNNQIITSAEKIALIPTNLREELDEAILYAYFAVRYYDEHIFKVILTRTNKFALNRDYNSLLGKDRSFNNLTNDTSYSRHRLNQISFEIALDKDYTDIAFHFIETGQVHITWEMVRKMISRSQEYLVKQCIKYGSKFDAGSASLKKIIFAGRTAAPLEDRAIKLVDFIQVMLELKWKSKDIKEILKNYSKKGKIDSQDMREMFLMFAVKRKIKLMSYMINGEEFMMEFQESNFIDVIENDAFEVAVLLYREYFLILNNEVERINTLLVNAFSKTNGMLEAKCYLLKRFVSKMNFEQANKFLEAVETRVFDSSKGNLLILTLNVVKASCLLIELLEKVHSKFSFLGRRVQEIKQKIIKIALDFMNDIQSEEEMRFFLLEKDLDERDALNNIYDYEILDLLENPFAQNIVQQIWSSQYNNSHSLFSVSTVHTLLFNYNHCRYDMEEQLRFYKKRDLKKYGCHPFQFQVWRFSAESRHIVQTITTWIFIIIMHVLISRHMSYGNFINDNEIQITNYIQKFKSYQTQSTFTPSQSENDITTALYNMWIQRLVNFEQQAMVITFLMFSAWLFLFQKIFDAIFAGKNKRVPHMVNAENFLDFALFFIGFSYIMIIYRVFRWDTWLKIMTPEEHALIYWENIQHNKNVNENIVLFTYGIILWMKAFYQLKLISITGSLFAIMVKLMNELFIFAIFYFSVLFLYSVVGVVLFYDLPNFSYLSTAMFTLFRATIQDYDVDQMRSARISPFLGYVYFLSFLILNLTLIVNLIVGQLSYAYKYYSKRRGILMLLSTLSVREVSEADEKYSSVISAPFPLCILNFIFGGIVITMKSIPANVLLLRIYFLPIAICSFIAFILYQVVMLPFCYVKMVGHKFALMVRSPQGQGARSTCDRAFQAILFLIIGPLLLVVASFIDMFWFLRHQYMMDLDKSHLQVQQSTTIHRRTYKKMYKYFEQKNEQLVPQKKVAEDLRKYLDVMEGIRCMIYGKPNQVPEGKAGIYIAYAHQFIQKSAGKKPTFLEGYEDSQVEQVVNEFEVVKQVLLNNSFPVDMREIQQNSVKKKGWGMKQLFDKKTFFAILQDLERMRKILNLKKCFFIFHIPYEGKPRDMDSWHKKVEARINMTLKFLNTARLLRIIGYDPVLHIKAENINLAKDISIQQNEQFKANMLSPDQIKLEPKNTLPNSYQKVRINNVQQNMQFMINKYINAGKQMKELADIMKQLNYNNNQHSNKNIQQQNEKKKIDKDDNFHYDSSKLQFQSNFNSNSKISNMNPSSKEEKNNNQAKYDLQVHYSERSNSEAVIPSDDEDDKVQKDEINTFNAKKNK